MILSQIRRENFPYEPQFIGAVTGWIILVTAAAGLVSPKTLAFLSPITLVGILVLASARLPVAGWGFFKDNTFRAIAAFLSLLVISLSWSANPANGFLTIIALAALSFGSLVCYRLILSETKPNIIRMAEGLWFGLLAGLIYLTWDLVAHRGTYSHLSLQILVKYIKLGGAEVTRSITPVTLLLGPALLAVMAGVRQPWQTIVSAILVALASLVVIASPHETSKLGLVGWMFIWSLATWSATWAHRAVVASWASACLLVVPFALSTYALEFQKSRQVQETAQARFIIWHEYATHVADAPLLGHGFNMSSVIRLEAPGVAELPYVAQNRKAPVNLKPFRAVHPHNVYLQVWFEFGALGALLFFTIGLTIIQRVRQLEPRQIPAIYATIMAAIAILFSSYGLWQFWFLGLFAFVTVVCATSIRISNW